MQIKKRETLNTDILIIGGGTAGCYAALTIAEKSGYSVLIAEKANIKKRLSCSWSKCHQRIHR